MFTTVPSTGDRRISEASTVFGKKLRRAENLDDLDGFFLCRLSFTFSAYGSVAPALTPDKHAAILVANAYTTLRNCPYTRLKLEKLDLKR